MSTEDKSPSFGEKAVNLAKFSWDLIKYVQSTNGAALTVTDEVYAERIKTCQGLLDKESWTRNCPRGILRNESLRNPEAGILQEELRREIQKDKI